MTTVRVTSEPSVAYRDADLLVLVKPAGLATTSPDGRDCLVAIAHELDPRAPRLHPTSRLDAEVTGLVTFARTERATTRLLEARRRGDYHRRYLALASRAPEPAEGRWSWPIALDRTDKRRRVAGHGPSERHAETEYRTAGSVSGAACLHLYPHTGRTHQLRVHASKAGCPLLGDVHYGGPRRVTRADGRVVTASRVMLHCAELDLPASDPKARIRLFCEAPDDLRSVWAALGGEPSALEPPRA